MMIFLLLMSYLTSERQEKAGERGAHQVGESRGGHRPHTEPGGVFAAARGNRAETAHQHSDRGNIGKTAQCEGHNRLRVFTEAVLDLDKIHIGDKFIEDGLFANQLTDHLRFVPRHAHQPGDWGKQQTQHALKSQTFDANKRAQQSKQTIEQRQQGYKSDQHGADIDRDPGAVGCALGSGGDNIDGMLFLLCNINFRLRLVRLHFQAVLPLRGKILNVERARIDKMLANNELKSLIIALGTNIGEQFNIDKLRYHRIVIMTDADVDGSHIRTLLLTFFFRYFRSLIQGGYIYIAQPPLYRLERNKKAEYVYSDEELEQKLKVKSEKSNLQVKSQKLSSGFAVKSIGDKKKDETVEGDETQQMKYNLQRYKGLGEMNPSQLWETTLDPENRMMKQVNIDDAESANEIFEILMGSDVAPRKKFIQTNAKTVKNLDI